MAKTSKIQEVHQSVFGVPGTEDKGMAGDIKDIKNLIKEQNCRYDKLKSKVYYLCGVVACIAGGTTYGIVD